MDATQEASVVFARLAHPGLSGDSRDAPERVLARLGEIARSHGATLVKLLPEKVMAVADSSEAAAELAARMHGAMDASGAGAIAVGFHYGPLIRLENDAHGGTVNLAARIADRAAAGTILTTQASARLLGAAYRGALRPLGALRLRGVRNDVNLCELLWRADGETTLSPASAMAAAPAPEQRAALSIFYAGQERHFPGAAGEFVVGRDPACDLVVPHELASRQHCTIERRQDCYVLSDHSANGTWVTLDGREVRLHREDMVLGRRGRIALGKPGGEGGESVSFVCD